MGETETNFKKFCKANREIEDKMMTWEEHFCCEDMPSDQGYLRHFQKKETNKVGDELTRLELVNKINKYMNTKHDPRQTSKQSMDTESQENFGVKHNHLPSEEQSGFKNRKFSVTAGDSGFGGYAHSNNTHVKRKSSFYMNYPSNKSIVNVGSSSGSFQMTSMGGRGTPSETEMKKTGDAFIEVFEKEMKIQEIGHDAVALKKAFDNRPSKNIIIIVYSHVFKNSLFTMKYGHVNRPKHNNLSLVNEMATRFIAKIQDKLSLPANYCYLYTKAGKQIKHLTDIDKECLTLMITKIPNFVGLELSGLNNNKNVQKYISRIDKIETALLKRGEFTFNCKHPEHLYYQNRSHDIVIVNNIITLLEKKVGVNAEERDWNYYSSEGTKYVPPRRIKTMIAQTTMKS
jgi:hypothetical protein